MTKSLRLYKSWIEGGRPSWFDTYFQSSFMVKKFVGDDLLDLIAGRSAQIRLLLDTNVGFRQAVLVVWYDGEQKNLRAMSNDVGYVLLALDTEGKYCFSSCKLEWHVLSDEDKTSMGAWLSIMTGVIEAGVLCPIGSESKTKLKTQAKTITKVK